MQPVIDAVRQLHFTWTGVWPEIKKSKLRHMEMKLHQLFFLTKLPTHIGLQLTMNRLSMICHQKWKSARIQRGSPSGRSAEHRRTSALYLACICIYICIYICKIQRGLLRLQQWTIQCGCRSVLGAPPEWWFLLHCALTFAWNDISCLDDESIYCWLQP